MSASFIKLALTSPTSVSRVCAAGTVRRAYHPDSLVRPRLDNMICVLVHNKKRIVQKRFIRDESVEESHTIRVVYVHLYTGEVG